MRFSWCWVALWSISQQFWGTSYKTVIVPPTQPSGSDRWASAIYHFLMHPKVKECKLRAVPSSEIQNGVQYDFWRLAPHICQAITGKVTRSATFLFIATGFIFFLSFLWWFFFLLFFICVDSDEPHTPHLFSLPSSCHPVFLVNSSFWRKLQEQCETCHRISAHTLRNKLNIWHLPSVISQCHPRWGVRPLEFHNLPSCPNMIALSADSASLHRGRHCSGPNFPRPWS